MKHILNLIFSILGKFVVGMIVVILVIAAAGTLLAFLMGVIMYFIQSQ